MPGRREWLGQRQGKQGFLVTLCKPQSANWYSQWLGIYVLSAWSTFPSPLSYAAAYDNATAVPSLFWEFLLIILISKNFLLGLLRIKVELTFERSASFPFQVVESIQGCRKFWQGGYKPMDVGEGSGMRSSFADRNNLENCQDTENFWHLGRQAKKKFSFPDLQPSTVTWKKRVN